MDTSEQIASFEAKILQLQQSLARLEQERDELREFASEICGHLRRKDKSLPTISDVRDWLAKYAAENAALKAQVEELLSALAPFPTEISETSTMYHERCQFCGSCMDCHSFTEDHPRFGKQTCDDGHSSDCPTVRLEAAISALSTLQPKGEK